jgi:hypothetical protein
MHGLRTAGGTRIAVLLLACAVAAVGAVPAAAQEDTPPILSNLTVGPTHFDHFGGTVTISADVQDDVGIAMVYADVSASSGSFPSVQLLYQGQTGDVQHYSGSAQLPSNFTDEAVSYGFTVVATDTNGGFAEGVAGEAEVAAQPQFDEAPVVSDSTVTPRTLPASGGTVVIRARASDNRSVSEVYADVVLVGGGSFNVPLDPISSAEFQGELAVPANAGPGALKYTVQVVALDDIGQPGTEDAGSFTVAAPHAAGILAVTPAGIAFGRVRIGRQAHRKIVVRNDGKARVDAEITVSGRPFWVRNPWVPRLIVRVRPRRAKSYQVGFWPTTQGRRSGAVTIHRPDGAQPDIVVPLSGSGTHRR